MTRLHSLPLLVATLATLGIGAASATTIITQGSNTVRIHQSPAGSATVISSPGTLRVMPGLRPAPVVLEHHTHDLPEIATRNPSLFPRMFLFLSPLFDGFHRSAPIAPHFDDDFDQAPYRGQRVMHASPDENRAVIMMDRITRRLGL